MKYPIPHDALDDRLAWTGSSGTGKTYDAGTAIERVLKDKSRVCIVDPLGVWWGLRLLADGEAPSPFKVAIFGGPHGDVAITPTSGKLIGETVAGAAESCLIDLSEFDTEADQRRFMLAFLVALYGGLKGDLLHLVLDEADMWAPQRILDKEGDATKLHHNMQKIVRRGRVKGFIPWLITQRPAEISKSILSMVDGMIMHQALSPQDINALMEWVRPRADKSTADMIYNGLPAFKRGEAAVYIPRRRVLAIAQFPQKSTFDSSRSPDRGEKKNRPDIALKPLDIEKLKTRLAKVEAEAKANDPTALKADIAKLRSELAKVRKAAPAPAIDKESLKAAELRGFEQAKKKFGPAAQRALNAAIAGAMKLVGQRAVELVKIMEGDFKDLRANLPGLEGELTYEPASTKPGRPAPAPIAARAASAPRIATTRPETGDDAISGPEQRILNAIRWWNVLGIVAPSQPQVGFVAGYSHKSGTWSTYLGRLRSKGWIDGRGELTLTDAGAVLAQEPAAPPTAESLRETVLEKIDGPLQRILRPLIDAYPQALSQEETASAAGYSHQSGTWSTYLGRMRSLELITGRGELKAENWLFPA